jgi:phage FluMu protein Com
MPISISCTDCSKKLRVADTLAGKAIKCPQCTTVLRVPGTATATTTKPAAAVAKPEPPVDEDENVKPAPGAVRRKPSAAPGDPIDAPAASRSVPEASDLPEELREMVRGELTKGERLIWLGQPDAKLILLRAYAVCAVGIVVMLLMTGEGVRKLASGPRERSVGAILIAIGVLGCAVAAGVPFFQRWKATKSCYVLTSRRAFVFDRNTMGFPQMTIYSAGELGGMRRRDWWFFENAGDVIFRTKVTIEISNTRSRGLDIRRRTTYYGFLAVRHPQKVEALVRETLVDPILDKLNA